MIALIKEGTRSAQVADVQARLRASGFEIADDTGTFGPHTTHAVRAFQQRRGILTDGIVGPHTWRELVEAGWRLGDRALYLKSPPMRGDDVSMLQSRLNALGFAAGKEDGIFGVDTDRAVRNFQREYAVAEDGIFGPRTHAGLTGLRVDRPGTAADLREELRLTESRAVSGALVAIDPGHGGEDTGAEGSEGMVESDACWDIAMRVAERLVGAGARVRFTRTEIENPDVSTRAARANQIRSDVMISIHLNESDTDAAEGATSFYFGGSVSGRALAENIQDRLTRLGLVDCRHHGRYYPILKETQMPAVIVEPVFATNPAESKQLLDVEFRNRIADAITEGLRDYFEAAR
jgi:N-acetylmuramoyl-L-alanine amidase